MAELHQKKETKDTNTINPVVAGIAGVVAGGVAVATAIAMNDKKNQEKVKESLDNVKDKSLGYMGDLQKQAKNKKEVFDEKLAEGKDKVKKIVEIIKE